jgi:catechol 2,3-dioxygenase-like lactoylglutathione lyase family enzyme
LAVYGKIKIMKLQKSITICYWSPNPDELMKFYRDVLELQYENKSELPDDYGYEFLIADNIWLWIGRHSEVHGYNKEPVRNIVEPFVSPMSDENRTIRVFTFHDPEGNCLQIGEGY